MTHIWVVFENDYEGSFAHSAWTSEELANAEIVRLCGKTGEDPDYYSVELVELDKPEGM